MKVLLTAVKGTLVILLIAGSGYALYKTATPYLTAPCATPILYNIGAYDKRFGISEVEFKKTLTEASELWNTAGGRVLVQYDEAGTVPVSLVYGEVQKVEELGATIDTEQMAYDKKKVQVETIRQEFLVAKRVYERLVASFDRENTAYEKSVEYWNARGGAPPDEYKKLQAQQEDLKESQRKVNTQIVFVNALSDQVNEQVDELNALADTINKKADAFNANAGEDFDQGEYTRDKTGNQEIHIYGFADTAELRRVLAHEFGHALGLSHVENPDSIMYSYNIAENFELSAEDLAELTTVCNLK